MSTQASRGSAALLTVLTGMLMSLGAIGMVAMVTDVVVAASRARTAADAAALGAMGAAPLAGGAGDEQDVAAAIAEANGVRLVACCGSPRAWPPRVEVVVAAAPRLPAVRLLLAEVRMRAAASARPR